MLVVIDAVLGLNLPLDSLSQIDVGLLGSS